MKFISDPVKYKQRYRWERDDDGYTTTYIDALWVNNKSRNLNLCIVRVPKRRGPYGAGYYLSNIEVPDGVVYDGNDYEIWRDIGPYPDLPTAKATAEVFITLKVAPQWKWKRRKK